MPRGSSQSAPPSRCSVSAGTAGAARAPPRAERSTGRAPPIPRRRREPDLRHELRLHRLVHVLRQRRDRRAGVDDRRRPEPRLRHGDPRAAHRDAAQRDEVEGWLRRVLDEAGGPDVAGVRRVVGVEELGRRRAERDDAAALGVEHGGEAVGEAGDVELRRQRPPSPAEPGDARLVRLEDAFVDVAAAERDAPRGEATCIVVAAEGEAVGGELADGERPVAVVVDVDAAPVAPAPPAARRERERAAQRRVAGERGVGGRRGRVQHRGGALLEAVQARRALRPHEIAPRVERQRHGPRRRAHGHVHQVLVRHDPPPALSPARTRAHRRRLRADSSLRLALARCAMRRTISGMARPRPASACVTRATTTPPAPAPGADAARAGSAIKTSSVTSCCLIVDNSV